MKKERLDFSKIGVSESNLIEAWRLCLSVRMDVKLGLSCDGCNIYVKYLWKMITGVQNVALCKCYFDTLMRMRWEGHIARKWN
jgi:hypothetical protein